MSYRYALCSEVFTSPIEETIRAVAALGFEGIEIAPFNVADDVEEIDAERRAELRQCAADAGIEIIGLHWLLVSPPDLHLTRDGSDVRQRTSRYLQSLTHFCADLGGTVMTLGSPLQRNLDEGTDLAQAIERAAEVLRPVGATCVDRGVRVLIEALNPKETNFLQTIESVLELRDAVDSPGVHFMLDVKAMSGMPRGIEGTILQYGADAGHFHANDPTGKGPGMGDTEFGPILGALRDSGYEGWVSSEPFDYEPDPETIARTALETLRAAAGE